MKISCLHETIKSNMKRLLNVVFCFCFLFFAASVCFANPRPGKTVSFNQNWRFNLGEVPNGQDTGLNDAQWRQLDLPHDWSIEGKFDENAPSGTGGGALPGGIGWYRKTFTVPLASKGKLVFVEFDGVYRNSEVWINGHYLGKRPYGYSTFEYELTPHLIYGGGPNVIAVRVDNSQQPNSRWYSGSGIYRNVWLTATDRVHVDHWGTYITTPEVSAESAKVDVTTSVRNDSDADRSVTLVTTVYDAAGKAVAQTSSDASAAKGATVEVAQSLSVPRPVLWSDTRPYLYKAVSQVKSNGAVTDRYETPFGIRSFVFDREKGFLL